MAAAVVPPRAATPRRGGGGLRGGGLLEQVVADKVVPSVEDGLLAEVREAGLDRFIVV